MRKIEREPNGAGIFRPGQDLVVAGTVGKNGVKAALSAKEKEISARFPEWFVKRIREQAEKKSELTPEMLNACGAGEWEEISEGGILAALWIISVHHRFLRLIYRISFMCFIQSVTIEDH